MADPNDEKFIFKDIACPNCGKGNRLAIIKQDQNLSERYQNLLINAEYRITKKGAIIACQDCGQKIKTD
ncbi:MAG: hypothetical protein NT116_00250 [Candidatus Parcubacteria bacterium]|nr:hypothetical protein [Candidatus Parcubacteria bacterium]